MSVIEGSSLMDQQTDRDVHALGRARSQSCITIAVSKNLSYIIIRRTTTCFTRLIQRITEQHHYLLFPQENATLEHQHALVERHGNGNRVFRKCSWISLPTT